MYITIAIGTNTIQLKMLIYINVRSPHKKKTVLHGFAITRFIYANGKYTYSYSDYLGRPIYLVMVLLRSRDDIMFICLLLL